MKKRTANSLQSFLTTTVPAVIANTVLSIVISYPLIKSSLRDDTILYAILDLMTFVSHYFFLNMVLGLITYLFSYLLPNRLPLLMRIILFFLFQTFLIIDTKIYSIFHYHLNAIVWNVISTEGAGDSVILGNGTIMMFLFFLALLLIAEILINVYVIAFLRKMQDVNQFHVKAISKSILIMGLCMILMDKGMYAYADLVNNTKITKNVKLYPLYQPLTIKRFVRNVLNVKIDREHNFKVDTINLSINYPKTALQFDATKDKKYNIILIVVEGLRYDMLSEETMPSVWMFGKENLIFSNHYSGGNGSRFGIFSLLYGIHGSYWHVFLSQRVSPVLIDSLLNKEYDFKILSSTKLTFPEFRKTAFIRIPQSIEDRFESRDMTERDRIITEKMIDYISSPKRAEKPFFAFLFYNSSHQMYKYPKEFEKFLPVINKEDINYFVDTDRENAHLIRNRYKNALLYEDHLIGKIVSSLEANGIMDKTIVVITGDHGEEFYENGYFGHTSSFSDFQTKTVFVLRYPGERNRVIERMTSHIDLVPTLMVAMGCTSQPEHFSQGISLLAKDGHPYVSSASWDRAAVIDEKYRIIFSTELYNFGSLEVRRARDYSFVDNPKAIMRQQNDIMLDVILKMSEYYGK